MAKSKEKSITMLYKRHIAMIVGLILTAVLSLFLLLIINMETSNKNNILINVLGRQRMLTQVMAKDAGRIYEIQAALNNPSASVEEKDQLKNELMSIREDLYKSKDMYDTFYETIKGGYIRVDGRTIDFRKARGDLTKVIDAHDKIYPDFKKCIDIVLNEGSNTTALSEAVKYINDNNYKLLKYSDEITSTVQDYSRSRGLGAFYSVIVFVSFVLLLLILFFIRAYKSLFVPVSQLYMGLSEVGITIPDSPPAEYFMEDNTPVFSEVKTVFNELGGIIELIENLNKNIPFKDILKYIFDTFSKYIPYTYIGVALIEDGGKAIRASYGVAADCHKDIPRRLLGHKADIMETSLYRIVETGEERVINDLEDYVRGKHLKEYNKILLEEGIRSSITFPLKSNNENVGIIFFSSNMKNVYKKEHIRFLKTLAHSIALSLEEDILIDDMIISSSLALAVLTEERDPETGEHLQRMKTYSRLIAGLLSNLDKYGNIIDIDYINSIERFSPLHDIGKVAIRDEILLKPGKLTEEEFQVMKTHTIYGGDVLRKADENTRRLGRSIFKIGIEIAEGHHEKWDGSGYPYGRKGEEIPLSARIVAVADVFDALTSKRPYKKPFTFDESVRIITEGSRKHFDPEIVEIFIQNIDIIRNVYEGFIR